jgi:hypothetical protein
LEDEPMSLRYQDPKVKNMGEIDLFEEIDVKFSFNKRKREDSKSEEEVAED